MLPLGISLNSHENRMYPQISKCKDFILQKTLRWPLAGWFHQQVLKGWTIHQAKGDEIDEYFHYPWFSAQQVQMRFKAWWNYQNYRGTHLSLENANLLNLLHLKKIAIFWVLFGIMSKHICFPAFWHCG